LTEAGTERGNRTPGVGPAVVLIALYAVGIQLAALLLAGILGPEWLWRSLLLAECLFLAWLMTFLRRYEPESLGIRKVSWHEGITIVLWFQAIAFASDAVVLWLAPDTLIESYLQAFTPVVPAEWLGLAGVAILTAPILEELLFRGLLLSALSARFTLHTAILGSTLLFAAVHVKPIQVIAALPLGYMLAAYVARGGSLYVTAIAHILGNGFSFLGLVLPGIPWISADWHPDTLSGLGSLLVALGLLALFTNRYPP